jgi:UDP-N-acetyl-D-galactosamine dehydrogenase
MGEYVAAQVVKLMIKKGITVKGAQLLLLGITFKENCPDVRNTKIVDVVKALEDYGIQVTIFDPWANPAEVKHEYNLPCHSELVSEPKYDAIVLGVAHKEFLNLDLELLKRENAVVYDVKGIVKGSDAKL